MLVPAYQSDTSLPLVAHEGALITLKGIIRNTTSGTGYSITWDANLDGDFTYDYSFDVAENSTTNSVRDIGQTFEVPTVNQDTIIRVRVKVYNKSSAAEYYASMPIFIHDWTPSGNPANWTDEQKEVMRELAVQEAMWFWHKEMDAFEQNNTSTMQGWKTYLSMRGPNITYLILLADCERFPAYPPGTINDYGLELPQGFEACNDVRWNTDPYAETAVRLMNYTCGYLTSTYISTEDEENTCGFDQNGDEIICTPINGTDNNKSLAYPYGMYYYESGIAKSCSRIAEAFAKILPVHVGVPLQVGNDVKGNTMEFALQEIVDYITYFQTDAGSNIGCFTWYANSLDGSRAEASDAVAYALSCVEEFASPIAGVIVNNRVKYRIASNFVNHKGSNDLVRWILSDYHPMGAFPYTGAYIGLGRWLGIHDFDVSDNTVAFPGYSTYTRAQLRQTYDTYWSTAANYWTATSNQTSSNWLEYQWATGDYLCGNTSDLYNAGRFGSTFIINMWARALSLGTPALATYGSIDYRHQYITYLIRAQYRYHNPGDPRAYNNEFGKIYDNHCSVDSHSCKDRLWATVLAGTALTSMKEESAPIALGKSDQDNIYAFSPATFSHEQSFHPDPNSLIISYDWDVNSADGLWWDTGAQADFTTTSASTPFSYTYNTAGTYTATLRVTDNHSPSLYGTCTVDIIVQDKLPAPGKCLEFDGQDDYVHIENDNSLQPASAFTLEAWVMVDATTVNYGSIIDNGFATGSSVDKCGGYLLCTATAADPKFRFWACNGPNYPADRTVVLANSNYEENTWYHLAAVYTGSELQLFINGVLDASASMSGSVDYTQVNLDESYGLNIGRFNDDNETLNFDGHVDEVRIWSDARTPEEIRSNMCLELAGNEANLVAYYKMDEQSGSTLIDLSQSVNSGDLQNMDAGTCHNDSEAFNVWEGETSADWATASNWSDGLPESTDNIGISDNGTSPVIGASINHKNVSVASGASLTVNSGTLTVSNNFFNTGTTTINSSIDNNYSGSTMVNHGTMVLANSATVDANNVENDGNFTLNSNADGTGSIIVNGTSSGNITTQRYLQAAEWTDWQDGWHFLSSSVDDYAIASNFTVTPEDEYDFYAWSEPNNLWINYKTGDEPSFLNVNGSNNFEIGRGYMAAYKTTSTKSFTGELYLNDVEVTNLTISSGKDTYYSWHLLGNPYTSAISWYTNWTTDNIAGVAQIWNESAQSYSAINANEVIPTSNGFMIQVVGETGSLTIPKAKRTHNSQAFYKDIDYPIVKLAAYNLNHQNFQQTQIRFNPQSTNGYDLEYDSDYLTGYASVFYSVNGTHNLAVNSLPECEEGKTISLSFIKNEGNNFKINMYECLNMNFDVWLRDKKLNTEQNLSSNPNYIFTSNSEDAANRFEIFFSPVGIDEPEGFKNQIQCWSNNKRIYINNNSKKTGTIHLLDMQGKQLFEIKLNGDKQQEIQTDLSTALYIIIIKSEIGIIRKKIIVK